MWGVCLMTLNLTDGHIINVGITFRGTNGKDERRRKPTSVQQVQRGMSPVAMDLCVHWGNKKTMGIT